MILIAPAALSRPRTRPFGRPSDVEKTPESKSEGAAQRIANLTLHCDAREMRRVRDASRVTSRVLATTSGCDAFGCFRDGWFARARSQAFASTSASSSASASVAASKDSSSAPSVDDPAAARRRPRPPPPPKFTPPEINLDDPSRPRRPRPRARVDVADVFKAKASVASTGTDEAPDAASDADAAVDLERRRRAFHAARGMDVPEHGGPSGLEPTRYGDWERAGRVSDF